MSEVKWDIFKIALLAGLLTFLWKAAKDFLKFLRRPQLNISFHPPHHLRNFNYADTGWVRRVFNLDIQNRGRETAKRCVAILRILKQPPDTEHLEGAYALHWAGVPYTAQTTGAEPVDIGAEIRRLDVFFTDQSQTLEGSWLAIPFALSGHLAHNQAYLPPGEYEVEISISCENGKATSQRFTLISPRQWQYIEAREL